MEQRACMACAARCETSRSQICLTNFERCALLRGQPCRIRSAWLRSLLTDDDFDTLVDSAFGRAQLDCAVGVREGVCVHMRQCMPSPGQVHAVDAMASGLCRLFVLVDHCNAAKHFLQLVIRRLSREMDEVATMKGNQSVVRSMESDPCRATKRRVDEDVKNHIVKQSRQANLSTCSFASVHQCGSGASSMEWDEQEGCCMLSAGWHAFKRCATLSVVVDGKHLGNPAEECEAFAVLDPSAGSAMWLPLQACSYVPSHSLGPYSFLVFLRHEHKLIGVRYRWWPFACQRVLLVLLKPPFKHPTSARYTLQATAKNGPIAVERHCPTFDLSDTRRANYPPRSFRTTPCRAN